MINSENDTRDRDSEEQYKNANSLSTDEYYTKDDVDARLVFKADATDTGYETVELIHPDHSSWKVRYQRLGMGIVTVILTSSDVPASQENVAYITYASNIPAKYRPADDLFCMGTDAANNDRRIGIMADGTIRVYFSDDIGVYGSATFFSGQV